MHTTGDYVGASRNLNGDLIISFAIDEDTELEILEKQKDKKLVIDTKLFSAKRSLNANGYFWKLCDLIAQKLGTDKEAIYLMQLKHDGQFIDMEVKHEAMDMLRASFRYVEEYDDGLEYVFARCYIGSSHYDKAQMSRLIDGTVQQAKELGIDTWNPEEIANLIKNWEAR